MYISKADFLKEIRSFVSDGNTEEALDLLVVHISDFASYYSNDIYMLKGQLQRLKKQYAWQGILESNDYERLISRINLSILEMADKIEKVLIHSGNRRRGHLLHKIPSKMMLDVEVECIVRIAYLLEQLIENIVIDNDTIFQEVQISDVMIVELLDDNQHKVFEVRTNTDEEQFIINEEYTQWSFKVRPLKEGVFPLLLKVGVVETINGRERKRNILIEKQINVSIEASGIESENFNIVSVEDKYLFERIIKSDGIKSTSTINHSDNENILILNEENSSSSINDPREMKNMTKVFDLNDLDQEHEIRIEYDRNGKITRIRKIRRNERANASFLLLILIILVILGLFVLKN